MQQKAPEISVIMGIYNQQNKEYLEQAVESVLHQTFRDLEFILYDDGSDDDTGRWLLEYASRDERIRLLRGPENRGLAYSLNACIGQARGKYLARMDDDDICEPERLQIQWDYMEHHPETAFVGCNAKLIDKDGAWGIRRMPENPKLQDFLRFSPYIHPTVMIRRSVFDTQTAYRSAEDTLRCEDYELFMRLYKAGIYGYNLQQELFCYREDRLSYQKRKLCYRMDEARLRYRNFREMGCLFPTGWLYVLRPVAAAVVPPGLLWRIRKLRHSQDFKKAGAGNLLVDRRSVQVRKSSQQMQ